MRLNDNRLARLRRSLELALNQEWPQLSATQSRLRKIASKPIPIFVCEPEIPGMSAVATVATDGGENRLSLEPIEVQIIRVADSLGEIYFEDFVTKSPTPEARC